MTYQAHQDKVTKIKALDSCKIERAGFTTPHQVCSLSLSLRQPSSFCRDDSEIIGE